MGRRWTSARRGFGGWALRFAFAGRKLYPDMEKNHRRSGLLVVTVGVGTGHHAVTRAVADALRLGRPCVRPKLAEALDYTPRIFARCYAGSFVMSMSRAPRIYGLGYRISNRPHRPGRSSGERIRLWAESRILRRFGRLLEEGTPEIVVNTHFLTAPYVNRLQRQGRFSGRHVVVVTDIEAHRYWYAEGVDRYFVPSDYTADILMRWGIPSARITVSGIPVHRRWTRPLEMPKILARWRLPSDRPIVLLSGGAAFTCGPVVRIAGEILRNTDAHLVPLAGRNKRLLARFAALPSAAGRITPVGFTNRLYELVEAASLVVTKPGGVITAEMLAKGTPMVLLNPVPGHEAGNAEYLASRGAAVIGRTTNQTVEQVSRLLNHPEELEAMAEAARSLHKPGARIVADELRSMLGESG